MNTDQALKWWADKEEWQKTWGTKEVEIISVKLLDSHGRYIDNIGYRGDLTVRVEFYAREPVENAHFGVAIFRENDGLYCFGPNTILDGFKIHYINKGKGWFCIKFKKIPFSSGIYSLSVAIWDKKEFLPYSYHPGRYKFEIKGPTQKYALCLDCKSKTSFFGLPISLQKEYFIEPDISSLEKHWKKEIAHPMVRILRIDTTDSSGIRKDTLETGEDMLVDICTDIKIALKKHCLWLGIFRKDKTYCHAVSLRLNSRKRIVLIYPSIPLLAGDYLISAAIFDGLSPKPLTLHHALRRFKVLCKSQYHGLGYVRHDWDWRLP